MKIALFAVNLLAAFSAFIASLYWFKASQTKLPGIDKETGKPTGPISIFALATEITDAAQLNRIAARWSAAAAIFAAVTLLLNAI